MSALDTWMPIFIGDYLGDTAHLTTEQHGAYFLLMMHQWRRGKIPADIVSLAQIVRCTPARWESRIAPAILVFFTEENGFLIQNRLKAEYEKALEKSEKSTKAINSRWSKKKEDVSKDINEMADTNVSSEYILGAYPSPSPSEREESKKERDSTSLQLLVETPRKAAAPVGAENGFERFWNAYPRKVAKPKALQAWRRAICKASPDAIIAAVHATPWKRDQYDPHPASWLNAERWNDERPLTTNERLMRLVEQPAARGDELFATFPETNIVRLRA